MGSRATNYDKYDFYNAWLAIKRLSLIENTGSEEGSVPVSDLKRHVGDILKFFPDKFNEELERHYELLVRHNTGVSYDGDEEA